MREVRAGALAASLCALFVILMIVRVALGVGAGGGFIGIVITVGLLSVGSAWIVTVLVVIALLTQRRQLRALRDLRHSHPADVMCRIYGDIDFRVGIQRLSPSAAPPPKFMLLLATPERVEFREPRSADVVATIARDALTSIDVKAVSQVDGAPRAGIVLTVNTDKRPVALAFSIMRDSHASFLTMSESGTRDIAATIVNRLQLPGRTSPHRPSGVN